MDNIIKELKLQLGEKEVVLSMDEARKLKEALDELFGKGVVKEVPVPYPLPYPVSPTIWYWSMWHNWFTPGGTYVPGSYIVSYDSNTSAATLKVA